MLPSLSWHGKMLSPGGFQFVDQSHLAREKARADAEFYKAEREAESNKVGQDASGSDLPRKRHHSQPPCPLQSWGLDWNSVSPSSWSNIICTAPVISGSCFPGEPAVLFSWKPLQWFHVSSCWQRFDSGHPAANVFVHTSFLCSCAWRQNTSRWRGMRL